MKKYMAVAVTKLYNFVKVPPTTRTLRCIFFIVCFSLTMCYIDVVCVKYAKYEDCSEDCHVLHVVSENEPVKHFSTVIQWLPVEPDTGSE